MCIGFEDQVIHRAQNLDSAHITQLGEQTNRHSSQLSSYEALQICRPPPKASSNKTLFVQNPE